MKNVVITPAVGIELDSAEFFVKSLRQYYNDDIYIVISTKDHYLKEKLSIYNCKFHEVHVHKYDVQLKRYKYFLEILKKNNNYNKVFFCDCRDIYFQSNPFEYEYKGGINFFLEDIKINKCKYSKIWINKTFGQKVYRELSNKTICCGGTVLGTYDNMIKWLNLMDMLISKYPYKKRLKYLLTFRRDKGGRGCDQAHGIYIAHKNYFKDSFLYSNKEGPIATAFYLKQIKFNEKSQLINDLGVPYSVVHQYDKRWSEFSEKVKFLRNKLNIIESKSK